MSESLSSERLQLPSDEMRRLGYRVVDRIIEHLETQRDHKVTYQADRGELERRLSQPPPESGQSIDDVFETLERDVLANFMHVDHPRFFAYIPGPSNFVSVCADMLAAGTNIFAGTWLASAGPSQVELTVIDWLRQWCGMPATTGGLFLSGGSMANVTALAVARQVKLSGRNDDARVYCSDQTHTSVDRGMRLLGFQPEQITRLESDDTFRLDPDRLERAVSADRAAGKRPFCVIANAGTTNTGAVDPLPVLADFCQEYDLWLHVDGAYGAAAVICDEGRAALRGIERADSLVLDPHKWLFQPFECGCVLVRERGWLADTFRMTPDYLQDAHRKEPETNFCDWGLQLTRGARALKLWMSIKVFGLAAFRDAVRRGFEQARFAERCLREANCWEIVTPAQMGMLSFRYAAIDAPPEVVDAVNERLVAAVFDDGYAMISSTQLRGRTALRMCPINPRTSEDDIVSSIDRIGQLARDLQDSIKS